jgi:hypothetical protein
MTRRIFCKVLLVIVAIFGVLVLSGVLSAQGNSENAFERVREVQERHTDWLMSIDGVEGTAIGFNPNARLSVVVLLEKPGIGGIPQELEGVAVHPVVTGKIYALAPPEGKGKPDKPPKEEVDPTARFDRPVPIGVSTGHPDITAGTIGCRVTDGKKVYALSNNHVYANENQAKAGPNGDNVLQPGPYDGGIDPGDTIGTLYDFEPIVFSTSANNIIDAAIALSSTDNLGNATPSDGYGTPKSATIKASIGQMVQKYGRTTGLTKGRISYINVTVNVEYDSGVARFVNQIAISGGNFSAGGDSGSLVVVQKGKDTRRPVGLLFAGSSSLTILNPIDAVLGAFPGISIDGE